MIYKLIKKSCFSALSITFLLFGFINCGDSDHIKPDPPIPTNKTTPINEFYKELDFTAIAAHRGYYRKSAENSLAAFQDGIDLGIEFLEVDTRTTADGVIILFHDATLKRVTNGSGVIANINYSVISNLKLKDKDGVLTDEPIATLEQGLRKIKGKKIYIHIEVKDFNFSEVVKIVKKVEIENQVLIFAGDRDAYNTVRIFDGIFMDVVCRNSSDFYFYLTKSNVSLLNLAGQAFNASFTSIAREKNKLTWRGITNKPEDKELLSSSPTKPNLDRVIQINPSIIHTDYADLMIPYLVNKGKR